MFKLVALFSLLVVSAFSDIDIESLKIQAESGDAQAQHELGRLYETGDGVKTNYTAAVDLYSKSAAQHDAEGQYRLGNCYRIGRGVEADLNEAVKWYERAAAQHHDGAQNNLAIQYESGKVLPRNLPEAFRLYRLSAEQGNKQAQQNLGLCYLKAKGVEKDLKEAVKWFHLSAAQDYPRGQYSLGLRYLRGEGVEKDEKLAVEWIRKAAEQGYGNAVKSMVYKYEKGQGVEQDLDVAEQWYNKALKLGYTRDLKRQEKPENHESLFESADKQLKLQPEALGDQYVTWVKTAIEAKGDLDLETNIDPWLEELESAASNDWKMLRAIAVGYLEAANTRGYRIDYKKNGRDAYLDEDIRNRWLALKLMERAYPLAEKANITADEMATCIRDYLMMMLEGGIDDPQSFAQKTSNRTFEEIFETSEPVKDPIEPAFYERPAHPSDAENDGELILSLLGRCDLMVDDLVIPRDAQLPMAKAFYIEMINEHPSLPRPLQQNMLKGMADDEYVVWKDFKPEIRTLPESYRQTLLNLAACAQKYPETAGLAMATIMQQRLRLEAAAEFLELAGETNQVRNIRANQGKFSRCKAQPAGQPASITYEYRNGNEVEISLYFINTGTNLLERLEAGHVLHSELFLLKGLPNWFRKTGGFEQAGILEEIEVRTEKLFPAADHADAEHEVVFQPLEAGAYLVRARMKDGNEAETVLNIRDTMLYTAAAPSEVHTNAHTMFILCDALTGKPRPHEKIYVTRLSGGLTKDENNDTVDGPYAVEQLIAGETDENGCYVFEQRFLTERSPKLYILANLDQFPLVLESGWHDRRHAAFHRSTQRPFTTTDRPIYRPGDEGHILIWQGAETNSIPVQISESDSKTVLPMIGKEEAAPNRFGASARHFSVPDDARLGQYEVKWMKSENYGVNLSDLRVEQYRAPEFEVSSRQLDDGKIEIHAEYSYGKPVAGGQVSGSIQFIQRKVQPWFPSAPYDGLWNRGYWWNGHHFSESENRRKYNRDSIRFYEEFHAVLDAEGRTVIDPASFEGGERALESSGYFNVSADVTDAAKKEHSTHKKFPNKVKAENLCCWTDKAFFQSLEKISLHTASGKPEDLKATLFEIEGTNNAVVLEQPVKGETHDFGLLEPGLYEAVVKSKTGASSQPFRFSVLGANPQGLDRESPIRLVREKAVYDADEEAAILIQTDQPGRYVYFFDLVVNNRAFTRPTLIYMDGTEKLINVPFNGQAGKMQCAVMTVADGKIAITGCMLHAAEDSKEAGRVALSPDKPKYAPGEMVTVELQAQDASGRGKPGMISVSVYNRMLDSFRSDSPVNNIYRSLFSGWRYSPYYALSMNSGWPRSIYGEAPDWVMRRHGTGTITVSKSMSFMPAGGSGGTDDLFGDAAPADGFYSAGDAAQISVYGSAIGSSGPGPIVLRENFADHAYWNAMVETDAQGRASIQFPVPDSMTEWKVQAWAMDTNYAASGETSFKCAKDLVLQLNTPRFLLEGDEIEISASVRNHTTNALTVTARSSLSMLGSVIKDMEPGSEKLIYWKYKPRKTGTKTIKALAQSGRVGDGMSKPLPILTRSMLKRGGDSGIVIPEHSAVTVEVDIPEAVDLDSLQLQLNATPNMMEAVAGALPYLASYPHGCTEQTLNRFLPSVMVLQTLENLGLKLEDLGSSMPPERQAVFDRDEVLKRAQKGITNLSTAQSWNGYWCWNLESSFRNEDPVVTAWVTRGLKMASSQPELEVDKDVFAKSLAEMVEQLSDLSAPPWRRRNDVVMSDAHVLQAVVLQELNPDNYLTRDFDLRTAWELMPKLGTFLKKHTAEFSLYGNVLLAYYFELRGETGERDDLITYIEQYLEHDPELGTYWLRTSSDHWWRWYNDDIEIMAWYLKLLNRVEPDDVKTAGVARWLLINRKYGDHWKSTRDTAIAVEALCEYIVNHPDSAKDEPIETMLNGLPVASGLKPGANSLLLKSRCEHPMFYDATWSFQTLENPITAEACDLVNVSREYYRVDPLTHERTGKPIDETETVAIGESLEIELTFETAHKLEYLLATDRRPAGFEALQAKSGYRYNGVRHYMEIHNERMNFYIDRLPKGTTTISYQLRAEHAGKVSALPATIELMYAPDQAANSAEQKLIIER